MLCHGGALIWSGLTVKIVQISVPTGSFASEPLRTLTNGQEGPVHVLCDCSCYVLYRRTVLHVVLYMYDTPDAVTLWTP